MDSKDALSTPKCEECSQCVGSRRTTVRTGSVDLPTQSSHPQLNLMIQLHNSDTEEQAAQRVYGGIQETCTHDTTYNCSPSTRPTHSSVSCENSNGTSGRTSASSGENTISSPSGTPVGSPVQNNTYYINTCRSFQVGDANVNHNNYSPAPSTTEGAGNCKASVKYTTIRNYRVSYIVFK